MVWLVPEIRLSDIKTRYRGRSSVLRFLWLVRKNYADKLQYAIISSVINTHHQNKKVGVPFTAFDANHEYRVKKKDRDGNFEILSVKELD